MNGLQAAGLGSYPFAIVPPTEATTIWADRRDFQRKLKGLINAWKHNTASGIYLLWADLGAGKTHALRYLEGVGSTADPRSLGVYCDVPDSTTNFKDLYAQAASRVPEEVLADVIYQYRRTVGEAEWLSAPFLRGDRDTPRALWSLAEMGDRIHGDLARRWLRGERLGNRDLSVLGVTSWIKTSERAVRTLSSMISIMLRAGALGRVVMMFDEFQRIGQVSQKRLQDVNAGISSLLNACPERLSIILSYSFGTPENIKYMVTGEVRSRVVEQLHLEKMGEEDSVEFVMDLLSIHALNGASVRAFSKEAVRRIVVRLREDLEDRITPRKLMQACAHVLDTALAEGERFPLSPTTAAKLYRPPPEELL